MVEHTGRIVEYTYDDTYKLLEEKITNPDSSVSTISYTYDAVGNRLTKTENGFTTTYQYDDNNRLIKEDDITYSYDDNGNLKEKNSAEENITYFYDAENHLTRVETTRFGVTITVEYEYDDEGNSVRKVLDETVVINYLVDTNRDYAQVLEERDGNGDLDEGNSVRKVLDETVVINYLVDTNRDYAQVLEERDGNGDLLVRYVYGLDLISQTRGGATSYYHYDGLGSTRALTASNEAITDTYVYDAFGNLLDKTGTTTNTYLYTGEFFDTHIGFYYLRARYLNPAIGRFITMDSFAGRNCDPYSLHKYLYAHANPINNTDPSGQLTLNELTVVGGVLGALAGMNVYRLYFDDPSKSTWERALGYTTAAAGGALIGGLLAHGAWALWFAPPAIIAASNGVVSHGRILADNNVLVEALENNNPQALDILSLRDVFITPNQYNEFIKAGVNNVGDRLRFLTEYNIRVIPGSLAAEIASQPLFQEIFRRVAPIHGRADAALLAFSKVTGFVAVTIERGIYMYGTRSLPMTLRVVMEKIASVRS